MRISRLAAVLGMAAILPIAAQAHLEPSQAGRAALARFKALDTDGDRALSKAELSVRGGKDALRQMVEGNRPASFARLDRDRDGRLEMAELRPSMAGWRPERTKPEPAARPTRKAEESRPLCWVPNFGDADHWLIEMPVLAGESCTTR